MLTYLRGASALLAQPARLLRGYTLAQLPRDLTAGVTVGLVLLPQALAFSLLAGMPPESGLYAAIVAAVAGALWGSSSHLHTGPTNTAAILTLSVLLPIAEPGSPEFIAAAGLIAVMAGAIRLVMGLARLGLLVNFVSDAVAVGFTAGAGVLIILNQLEPLLRLSLPPAGTLETLGGVAGQIGQAHPPSLLIGLLTIGLILGLPRLVRRVPGVLSGIVAATAAAWALDLGNRGVLLLGSLPQGLPPFQLPPVLDLGLIGELANGALALAIIGLVEAVAIARAVGGYSHQRLDSNQEFVGQGLANIAAGLFSGYPCSGSFNRSALSYQSGATSALGNLCSGLFVLLAVLAMGPLISQLPRPVLAGALAVTAYSMVDRRTMLRIWRADRGDGVTMLVTLATTLLLPLQFAVLIGVLMSLGYYLLRTSTPKVQPVLPDATFSHWTPQGERPACPQLAVLDVLGDLYFGAVNHVEEQISRVLNEAPRQRFLLLRVDNVQHCDISGIKMLENVRRVLLERGGELYFVGVREGVRERMRASGFLAQIGEDRLLHEDRAIGHLFHHVIDPAVCIYECEQRAFRECQSLPKRLMTGSIPLLPRQPAAPAAPTVAPRALWEELHSPRPPLVVDVREPREFRLGHVPGARLLPLPELLAEADTLPGDRRVVLACRSGRRSARAAELLAGRRLDLRVLEGGMLAWGAANLLEAVEV